MPPIAQSVPPVEKSAPVSHEYADPMARIQEIKHIVNQKVGNPVKLIESHNEIGHEYMNALLDAMKKATGAVQGDLNSAMQRLESAFAVIVALDLATPTSLPAKKEASAPSLSEVPAQSTPVSTQEAPLPAGNIEQVAEQSPAPLQSTLTIKEEKPILTSLSEVPAQASAPLIAGKFTSVKKQLESTDSLPEKKTRDVIEKEDPTPLRAVPVPPAPVVEAKQETSFSSADISGEALPEIHSVGKEKQLQDLLLAKRQKEATTQQQQEQERIAAMDPFMTPEVTAGLSQLLSEWSLFKSSGIFGIGPSGKDHVLYKRIAPLTMAAVIAGRFEGATPAIKQSITDYMNGWRYEEGIVHEHTETFEHYLRRVIYHILNKKKLAA